jgi:hypothetical protein
LSAWQHVAAELDKAAAGADPAEVSIALRLVLALERIKTRRCARGRPFYSPHSYIRKSKEKEPSDNQAAAATKALMILYPC